MCCPKKNSERNKKPYPPFKLNGRSLMQGWFFFQLSNWFQLIFLGFFPLKSYRTQSDQVKNGPYKREWRCFKLFFIDLQLFYFLFRIIPDFERQIFCFVNWTHNLQHENKSVRSKKLFFFKFCAVCCIDSRKPVMLSDCIQYDIQSSRLKWQPLLNNDLYYVTLIFISVHSAFHIN